MLFSRGSKKELTCWLDVGRSFWACLGKGWALSPGTFWITFPHRPICSGNEKCCSYQPEQSHQEIKSVALKNIPHCFLALLLSLPTGSLSLSLPGGLLPASSPPYLVLPPWVPSPRLPSSLSFFLSHPTGPPSFFALGFLLCGFRLPFLSPGLQLFLSSTEASVSFSLPIGES